MEHFAELETGLAVEAWNVLLAGKTAELNAALTAAGLPAVMTPEPASP